MKKILFFLAMVVGLSSSVYAVDLGTYERAKILQIATTDSSGTLYQVGSVDYQYWTANYPYNSLKYSGQVNTWYYTFDFATYYYYGTWVNSYLSSTNRPYTFIWVQKPNYTPNKMWLQRGPAGDKVEKSGYPIDLGGGQLLYLDENSNSVTNYEMVTEIIPPEGGTTDLYNTVIFNRFSN